MPFNPTADQDRYVKHWAYGEQMHFLVGCFLPLALAEQVVTDFLNTREPSPVVAWVEFESVLPRLAPDEYRKRRRQTRDRT